MRQLALQLDGIRDYTPFSKTVRDYPFIGFVCFALLFQAIFTVAADARVPFTGWLRVLSPMLAGLYVVWICDGLSGILAKLRSVLVWRIHLGWYLLCFLWFPLFAVVALFLVRGYEGEDLLPIKRLPWGGISGFTDWLTGLVTHRSGIRLLLICIADEIGWFGIGYVFLRRSLAPLQAGLVIGTIWGLSYVPIWVVQIFVAEDQPLWTVLTAYVCFAVVNAWIFEKTRSAIILALMQLISGNYAYNKLEVLPVYNGGSDTVLITATLVHAVALAGLLIYAYFSGRGRWMFSKSLADERAAQNQPP